MGFIYKITNKRNNKSYIGMTSFSVSKRWAEHKADSKKEDFGNRPLYHAMRKYGEDNFSIEVIEECSNDVIQEREIFYIDKFDTFKNGYNATIGGEGASNIPKEEILTFEKLFYEHKTIKKVSEITNRDPGTISKYLKIMGVDVTQFKTENTNPQFIPKKVLIVELGESFETVVETAQFLIDEGYTKASLESARVSVGRACSGMRKSYLGFTFRK